MKKMIFLAFLSFSLVLSVGAQSPDERSIRESLSRQTEAWNRGDVEGFMATYWKSDSLMFIGKSGVVWGWQSTLNNYKKGYPDTTAMGKLAFDIIRVQRLGPDAYFVVGKWMLRRTIGDLSGHYTLVFRKIRGRWLIVSDHSS